MHAVFVAAVAMSWYLLKNCVRQKKLVAQPTVTVYRSFNHTVSRLPNLTKSFSCNKILS